MTSDKKGLANASAREPTPEERAAAFRFMIIGAVVGFLFTLLLKEILDAESQQSVLWQKGRFALIGLFAWSGHLIGLGRGRAVAENVECLAIAVVMALILKHFLVEAYKIPTGSMQPTILGNKEVGIFDRVLVNKFAYLIDEPERYDVVVFKYPLDRSKNYIKRLCGLGGEKVSLFNGNIYVSEKDASGAWSKEKIARKPRAAREAVLKQLYPSEREGESLQGRFQIVAGDGSIDDDEIHLEAGATFRFGQGEDILDRYLDGYDPDWKIPAPWPMSEAGREIVGDLAIAFDITPTTDQTEVSIAIFAFGREHRVVLSPGGTHLESGTRNGSDALLPIPTFGDSPIVARSDDAYLSEGDDTRVGFLHVDQELILQIDDDEVLRFPYEVKDPLHPSSNAIEVTVRGGGATISDPNVWRDIHYTTTGSNKQSWEIPDDSLFVLGDNTQNSSDGRMWAAQQVEFPNQDTIITESRQAPNDGYVDIYGERYRFPLLRQPTIRYVEGDEFSFVPRSLLLGKAIAVFWPVFKPFRWKLIR